MQTMRTTNSRLMKTVGGEVSIRSRSIEVSGSSGTWISSAFHPSLATVVTCLRMQHSRESLASVSKLIPFVSCKIQSTQVPEDAFRVF